MNHACVDDVLCTRCGRLYEASKGCPSSGIAPQTAWEAVPRSWRCPDCGANKSAFESVEMIYQRAYCALTVY